MRELKLRRQNDSAKHYRDLLASSSAIRTTLALAAESADFPVAMLNILDDIEQYTLVALGTHARTSLPREGTICDGVVRTGTPRVIPDLDADGHGELLSLRRSGMRAYVGVPLTGREGLIVGTMCLLDVQPHALDEAALARLMQFARVIEEQLDLLRRLGPSRHGASVSELAVAIDEGQIVPWFQPVVDLRTERVVALEALARWEHPTRGLLQPADFIPLAEDSELIIDLDLAILRAAARSLGSWRLTDPEAAITVNISGRHFEHPECIDRLHQAVLAAEVPPEAVVLELTETSAFAASEGNIAYLARLRQLGFRVLLDDFGAGCSTLEHLVYLPCDGVKIDRATTKALRTPSGDAVVRAVAGLDGELGKPVVIEGVEWAEQAAWACTLGCTHGQGYLWSAPVRAEALLA